jgi:hypothetical protein
MVLNTPVTVGIESSVGAVAIGEEATTHADFMPLHIDIDVRMFE